MAVTRISLTNRSTPSTAPSEIDRGHSALSDLALDLLPVCEGDREASQFVHSPLGVTEVVAENIARMPSDSKLLMYAPRICIHSIDHYPP